MKKNDARQACQVRKNSSCLPESGIVPLMNTHDERARHGSTPPNLTQASDPTSHDLEAHDQPAECG